MRASGVLVQTPTSDSTPFDTEGRTELRWQKRLQGVGGTGKSKWN